MKKTIIDSTLLKYLLLFCLVAFLLSLASGFLAKWEGVAYASFDWGELLGTMILRYLAKLWFILFAIVLIRFLFGRGYITAWMRFPLHGLFAVGLTFYSVFSQVFLNNWLYGLEDPLTWDYVYRGAIMGTDYNFFLYFSMAAIVYAYYYFKKQKNFQIKETALKAQLLDAKLHALQTQLQPHFLFNTLNDISSLIDRKPEIAQDSIADLCEMLRQTLNLSNTKLISIEDEIELLRKYLKIEKVRFDEKLQYTIEVDQPLKKVKIPPLLLQPILENAIKHGFSYAHDSLAITLKVKEELGFVCISMINNGNPLETLPVTFGIGLSNVINRLETLYPENFEFDMSNLTNNLGVETKIKFPKQLEY